MAQNVKLPLEDVERRLNVSHILKEVHLHTILNKDLDDTFDKAAVGLGVLLLLLFIGPLLALSPAATVIHRLAAHWTAVVAPLQTPLFDAPFAESVSADELGADAVFEAHRALHSLTCFEE